MEWRQRLEESKPRLITVSATAATYIHDLDSYMFAMLCAVAAVWLWNRHPKGWLLGWALAAVSLGIHQSYGFLPVSLAMMVCALDLLNGDEFGGVFQKSLRAMPCYPTEGFLAFYDGTLVVKLGDITD